MIELAPNTIGANNTMHEPSESRLKLKSRKASFFHSIDFRWRILLKLCTKHNSHTVVLCAKFRKDSSSEKADMNKRDCARFQLDFRTGCIHCCQPVNTNSPGLVDISYVWTDGHMVALWESLDTFTVKPVYNDHLMVYFSAFWSSSRWPRAT